MSFPNSSLTIVKRGNDADVENAYRLYIWWTFEIFQFEINMRLSEVAKDLSYSQLSIDDDNYEISLPKDMIHQPKIMEGGIHF